ncbi:HNH endonuclease [Janthinobacterium violaceinigrum]|uniref:HNH endonuclease 5 domain-containing protein n=1 Tax=Janthinobacterium violaceinigrum TaxID=2654252 RepID=A0A6I1IBH2_9BURK|nr:HNH endonuclease [Janthinobacterium violaceinigrum]KAB8065726.1 hypothetical protein GCN75_05625 [Janthinobacterium violaceinigrum]
MKCIICRTNEYKMSDEHVIPESLGGFYHIYSVCENCNSTMGSKVDAPLINHKLTELYRFSEEIKGKTGKIPNPFSGVFNEENNKKNKAIVNIDANGKLKISPHPIIRINENNGLITSIEIEVDSENEDEIDRILSKTLTRNKIPQSAVIKKNKKEEFKYSNFETRWNIDTIEFKIGILKIAYEFAMDSIESYINNETSIEISNIIKNVNHEKANEYLKINFDTDAFSEYGKYIDLNSKKHYLILTQTDDGLICFVKLHGTFSAAAILSKDKILDASETIFGINDIEKKFFEKLMVGEVVNKCLGPAHTRFGFYSNSSNKSFLENSEINSPDFNCELNSTGDIIIYNKNGDHHPNKFIEILKKSNYTEKTEGAWDITLFDLGDNSEYYIKSEKSKKLFQVVQYEVSRERIFKI